MRAVGLIPTGCVREARDNKSLGRFWKRQLVSRVARGDKPLGSRIIDKACEPSGLSRRAACRLDCNLCVRGATCIHASYVVF